jgi:hypothetical protein
VLLRHNDVVAEWHHLCAQALSPAAVSVKPLIHSGRAGNAGVAPPCAEPPPELCGHIGVHGFWRRGATAIFDVRVTDTDAPYHRGQDPHKVLANIIHSPFGSFLAGYFPLWFAGTLCTLSISNAVFAGSRTMYYYLLVLLN